MNVTRTWYLATLLTVVALSASVAFASAPRNDSGWPGNEEPSYAPDRLLVIFTEDAMSKSQLNIAMKKGTSTPQAQTGLASVDAILQAAQIRTVERPYHEPRNAELARQIGIDRTFMLRFQSGTDLSDTREHLERDANVAAVAFDWQYIPAAVPNDPLHPNHWGHNNTGQLPSYNWTDQAHTGPTVGTVGFDANAEAAWDGTQGYGYITIEIAILDSGVDLDHPDLNVSIGYDFGDNDGNPDDDSLEAGHGTACAGVAAAVLNDLGSAGIAADCSILPCKVADNAGDIWDSAVQNAIIWAADNGAEVISMSFGGPFSELATDNAIEYAHTSGSVLLAATGNWNYHVIDYPARNPYVIGVGAASPCGERKRSSVNIDEVNSGVYTDPNSYTCDGERWWGSSYGSEVPNAADAVDILGPTILPTTDIVGSAGYDTGDYAGFFSGTSCATPYVAGVAALIIAKNPTWTPTQVRNRLVSTATDVISVESNEGWDRYSGYGMVDAQASVQDPAAPNAAFSGTPRGGSVPLTVYFSDQSTYVPTTWVWDFGDGHVSSEQNPSHTYSEVGTYTVSLTVINSGGSDVETKSDYIAVGVPMVLFTAPAQDHVFEVGDAAVITWDAIPVADSTDLELQRRAADGTFVNYAADNLTGTTWTVNLADPGYYRVHARAMIDGTPGDWNIWRSFSAGIHDLAWDYANIIDDTYEGMNASLAWTCIQRSGNTYTIERCAGQADCASPDEFTTSECSIDITQPNAGDAWFRVRVENANVHGDWTSWLPVVYRDVPNSVGLFYMLSPDEGEEFSSDIQVSWTEAANAEEYQIYISESQYPFAATPILVDAAPPYEYAADVAPGVWYVTIKAVNRAFGLERATNVVCATRSYTCENNFSHEPTVSMSVYDDRDPYDDYTVLDKLTVGTRHHYVTDFGLVTYSNDGQVEWSYVTSGSVVAASSTYFSHFYLFSQSEASQYFIKRILFSEENGYQLVESRTINTYHPSLLSGYAHEAGYVAWDGVRVYIGDWGGNGSSHLASGNIRTTYVPYGAGAIALKNGGLWHIDFSTQSIASMSVSGAPPGSIVDVFKDKQANEYYLLIGQNSTTKLARFTASASTVTVEEDWTVDSGDEFDGYAKQVAVADGNCLFVGEKGSNVCASLYSFKADRFVGRQVAASYGWCHPQDDFARFSGSLAGTVGLRDSYCDVRAGNVKHRDHPTNPLPYSWMEGFQVRLVASCESTSDWVTYDLVDEGGSVEIESAPDGSIDEIVAVGNHLIGISPSAIWQIDQQLDSDHQISQIIGIQQIADTFVGQNQIMVLAETGVEDQAIVYRSTDNGMAFHGAVLLGQRLDCVPVGIRLYVLRDVDNLDIYILQNQVYVLESTHYLPIRVGRIAVDEPFVYGATTYYEQPRAIAAFEYGPDQNLTLAEIEADVFDEVYTSGIRCRGAELLGLTESGGEKTWYRIEVQGDDVVGSEAINSGFGSEVFAVDLWSDFLVVRESDGIVRIDVDGSQYYLLTDFEDNFTARHVAINSQGIATKVDGVIAFSGLPCYDACSEITNVTRSVELVNGDTFVTYEWLSEDLYDLADSEISLESTNGACPMMSESISMEVVGGSLYRYTLLFEAPCVGGCKYTLHVAMRCETGYVNYTGTVKIRDCPGPKVAQPDEWLGARPNPFNPQIEYRYKVQPGESVSIAVYDLAGREVKRLVNGETEEGTRSTTWRGYDEGHRRMPSGIYLIAEKINGELRRMTKVTMLK